MNANRTELHELQQRIGKLTREEQLFLVEAILSDIRKSHFTDWEAYRQAYLDDYNAMLAHEEAQRTVSHSAEPTRAAG